MTLIQALINSDNAENEIEAREIIKYMQESIEDGEDPEEVLFEYGLEPDYIFDLI